MHSSERYPSERICQGFAPWSNRPACPSNTSSATIPPAPTTANAATATFISAAGADATSASAWSTAAPARDPTPNARAPPWSAPNCRPRRSSPSWITSARASASAPPAASPASPGTPSRATSPSPAIRPRTSTTNSWLFPPLTREAQFDEKWNFVAKKEKNCDPGDPADDDKGDDWDHTAVDPEHRLLLAVVPGERSAENCKRVVQEVYDRTDGRGAMLLTSDAYPPYATAIEEVYGVWVQPERKPGPGRPPGPRRELPAGLVYATVCKRREKGRVVEVIRTVVFGALCLLEVWLR